MRKFSNIQEIHAERENMRANKEIYTLLSVVLGEIDRLPTRNNPTEDEIYTVINKMYNNAVEMSQYSIVSKIEAEYLKPFIKAQLTNAELVGIIMQYKEDGLKNIGDFMRALNTEYKGRFNGKEASSIINQILKQ
jgi:uncharacterized protein YqeY